MSEIMIACGMLRDELELAMDRTGVRPEIVWMEKGLHDKPQNLRTALQAEIDRLSPDHDSILLALCYCGGALDGVGSQTATLAVPRFDDCTRMLLAHTPGQRNLADCHCLYFTRQWLDSERFIGRDYDVHLKRYGAEKATYIYQAMLANYRALCMVDTKAYPLSECEAFAQETAKKLNLAYEVQPGTIRILEKLLLRQLDEEFCICKPGHRFHQVDFLDMH